MKLGKDSWYVANLKYSGFYRVNYDLQNWNRLIKQLKTDPEKIDRINRAQILSDLFNLGRSELINQSIFFDAVTYLKKEQSPLPFEIFFSSIIFLNDIIESDKNTYDLYKVIF
jgi:aminopeptidase N